MHKCFSAAACALLLAGCGEPESIGAPAAEDAAAGAAAAAGSVELASDDERTIYALGVALGENVAETVAQFNLTEAEREIMRAGLGDALDEAPYQVDMPVYGPRIQMLADERATARADEEKAASAAYADEIAQESGAERSASGLVYVPVTEGTGESPGPEDTVLVHYHGTLRDGTVFDSSVERGDPIELALNGVIPCWTEGVPKMSVGGKAKLLCPSDIAYGDQGTNGIPGGAALLFEIELLEIIELPGE
jgi:FKBP-type peptidyl-prolyl cis-trans isomerase FkpA